MRSVWSVGTRNSGTLGGRSGRFVVVLSWGATLATRREGGAYILSWLAYKNLPETFQRHTTLAYGLRTPVARTLVGDTYLLTTCPISPLASWSFGREPVGTTTLPGEYRVPQGTQCKGSVVRTDTIIFSDVSEQGTQISLVTPRNSMFTCKDPVETVSGPKCGSMMPLGLSLSLGKGRRLWGPGGCPDRGGGVGTPVRRETVDEYQFVPSKDSGKDPAIKSQRDCLEKLNSH